MAVGGVISVALLILGQTALPGIVYSVSDGEVPMDFTETVTMYVTFAVWAVIGIALLLDAFGYDQLGCKRPNLDTLR